MDRGLTTIKAVVIGLGLAIVGVTVIIVMAAIDKANEIPSAEDEQAPVAATVSADPYADVAVALPPGAKVVTITGDGDVLSLLVERVAGSQSIVTVDRRTGEVLGTLELLPRGE